MKELIAQREAIDADLVKIVTGNGAKRSSPPLALEP